jgi:hypothetical protein
MLLSVLEFALIFFKVQNLGLKNRRYEWRIYTCTLLYGLQQAFFIERDPHSYTRHIERVKRGERDIVPSTQD